MIDQIKQEVVARKFQVSVLDLNGRLLESCHTHIDLRNHIGHYLSDISPIFEGLVMPILAMKDGDLPFHLPMITFSIDDKEYDLNMEFQYRVGDNVILWIKSTNIEFNYKLQQMQQERNDSVILLETISRQQQLLREYTDRLEAMNKGLDRFAYIVSHDLKSPLRAIGSLAEWIQEGLESNDFSEIPDHIELLKKRILRMESLIEGILHYSRAGRDQIEKQPVDLHRLLMEIMESEHKGDSTELVLPDNLPVLQTHRTSLSQVFSNLINNAIKYNDKDICRVEVFAEERDSDWQFKVKDNGPGIDPKHHEMIFEIFCTLISRDTYESTGIGLTIVQKIVQEHGGEIEVVSRLGEGATFAFTWPK